MFTHGRIVTSTNTLVYRSRNLAVRAIKSTAERFRPANERQLCYIHIGKCGGGTVSDAIGSSPVIAEAFDRVTVTHVVRPAYKSLNRYLFVVRNPIERAVSAFNWRYRLVKDSKNPDHRFPGEAEVLTKYGSLEKLALALYSNGCIVPEVAKEFRRIHHLREDVAFYLEPAFDVICPEQVFAVLCQETLDVDIATYLGIETPGRVHDNRSTTPQGRVMLSDIARTNLGRFLKPDFDALEHLMELFPLSEDRREALLRV